MTIAPVARSVVLLHWPEQDDLRRHLAARGRPRLLMVGPQDPIPSVNDEEDWIRLPASERDVAARIQTLAARVTSAIRLDGRVLRTSLGTVTLSEAEAAGVALLLADDRIVVPRDELAAALPTDSYHALNHFLYRLRRRIRPIGLDVYTSRRRGLVLVVGRGAD